jgi:hypothetical protein
VRGRQRLRCCSRQGRVPRAYGRLSPPTSRALATACRGASPRAY